MENIRVHGKPSYFLTVAADLNWPEITDTLFPRESPCDHSDLEACVFKIKYYDGRIDDILKKKRMFLENLCPMLLPLSDIREDLFMHTHCPSRMILSNQEPQKQLTRLFQNSFLLHVRTHYFTSWIQNTWLTDLVDRLTKTLHAWNYNARTRPAIRMTPMVLWTRHWSLKTTNRRLTLDNGRHTRNKPLLFILRSTIIITAVMTLWMSLLPACFYFLDFTTRNYTHTHTLMLILLVQELFIILPLFPSLVRYGTV